MFARLLPVFAVGALLMSGCTLIVEEDTPTEVRLFNDMDNMNLSGSYTVGSTSISGIDDIHLYEVSIGNAYFDSIKAGAYTSFLEISQSGHVTVDIGRMVVVSGSTRVSVTNLDPLTYSIAEGEQTTLAFDASSLADLGLYPSTPTEVRVNNSMANMNIELEYSTGNATVVAPVDNIDLYGVTMADVSFSQVLAGQTTGYKTISQSGAVTVNIASVDLKSNTAIVTFDDIDPLSFNVTAQQRNTVVFDKNSTVLFGALGKKKGSVVR
jgi:hypothetical protein